MNCLQCGAPVKAVGRRYCSRSCANLARPSYASLGVRCSIDGCAATAYSRGMCGKHDSQERALLTRKVRTRGLAPEAKPSVNCTACDSDLSLSQIRHGKMFCSRGCASRFRQAEEFWSRVSQTAGCWNWRGSPTSAGYGKLMVGGKRVYAHRRSYELVVGTIPNGMSIDHICHNRLCVNPAHLRVVTQAQNVQNHQGAKRDSATGVRGVHWSKSASKYAVQVKTGARRYWGGLYHSLEDAERAAIALRNRVHTHNDRDRKTAAEETVQREPK